MEEENKIKVDPEEEKAQLSRIGKLTASDFLIMLVGVLSIGLVTIILWMIM